MNKAHYCLRCQTKVVNLAGYKQPTHFNGTDQDARRAGWREFYWTQNGLYRGTFYWLCPEHAIDPYPDSKPA